MIAWDLEQNTPYLGKWGSKSLSRWSFTFGNFCRLQHFHSLSRDCRSWLKWREKPPSDRYVFSDAWWSLGVVPSRLADEKNACMAEIKCAC